MSKRHSRVQKASFFNQQESSIRERRGAKITLTGWALALLIFGVGIAIASYQQFRAERQELALWEQLDQTGEYYTVSYEHYRQRRYKSSDYCAIRYQNNGYAKTESVDCDVYEEIIRKSAIDIVVLPENASIMRIVDARKQAYDYWLFIGMGIISFSCSVTGFSMLRRIQFGR